MLQLPLWKSLSSSGSRLQLDAVSESGITYHSEFDCIAKNDTYEREEVVASYGSETVGIRSRCLRTQNEWQRRLMSQQRALLDVVHSKLRLAEETAKVGEEQKELLRGFRRIIRREVDEDERFHQISLHFVETDAEVCNELEELSRILDYPCCTSPNLTVACETIRDQCQPNIEMMLSARSMHSTSSANAAGDSIHVVLVNLKALIKGLPPELKDILKEMKCCVVLLSQMEELEEVGSFLLAASEAEIRDKLSERGISDYLLHPLSLDGLRGVVNQAFRRFFGDEYLLLNAVGRGTFGVVHKAKRLRNGGSFALKEINTKRLGGTSKADIDKEGQLMQDLRWPTVMNVVDTWENGREKLRYLLMPIMEGGSLRDRIGGIADDDGQDLVDPEKIHEWYVQCLHGICYLHWQGVLHRDIKLANILLDADDRKLRICDLGSAARLPGEPPHPAKRNRVDGKVTTPLYAPPEVLLNSYYCTGSDMWQFGATFYEVVTLEPLFSGGSISDLQAQAGRFDFISGPWHAQMVELKPDPLPVSEFCELLQRNPMMRPTASELVRRPENTKRLSNVLKNSGVFSSADEFKAHIEEFRRIQEESDSAENSEAPVQE